MQNRQFETKATIEAGLLSALLLILMLTTAYIPFLSFLNILLPIPITLLCLRHNYKVGISAVVVSGILVAMAYDPVSALGTSITYGLTGLTLGYCIKKEMKASKTICFMALASLVATLANILILGLLATPGGFAGLGRELNSTITLMNNMMAEIKEAYLKLGLSNQQKELANQMFPTITMEMVKSLLIASLVFGSFISAVLNYFIARAILKKLRYELVEVKPFSELYMSEKIGFVIAVVAIIAMLLQGAKIDLGKYIIMSVISLINLIFIIEGLAVATFFLKNKFKLSNPVVVLIFFFTITPFQGFYQIIGLVDIVMDFRKVNPNRLFKK